MNKFKKIADKYFDSPFAGIALLELISSLYASLFASLLLTTCINTNNFSSLIFGGLFFLLCGAIMTVRIIVRINKREKVYEKSTVIKKEEVSLKKYIRNNEEKNIFQYLLIYFLLPLPSSFINLIL